MAHPRATYQHAWVFPPRELIISTLRPLQQWPVHATLVLPDKVAMWTTMLKQLPIVASHAIHPISVSLGQGVPLDWVDARPMPLRAWRLCRALALHHFW